MAASSRFTFPSLTIASLALRTAEKREVTNEGGSVKKDRLRSTEMKAVMDSMTTGIAINDAEGRIVTMNKAAERLLSSSEHLLRERLPLVSLKARSLDGPPREDGIARVLRGEILEPLTVQIDPEEPGKPPRILLLNAAPIRDGARETLGVVAAFTDVTRLHEIQQEREDLLRALAHDMRAPLSSITINAAVIERAAGDLELTRASARSIAENARRMDRWIQEMLEMARLAAGEMHPRPEDLPLRGVIIDMTQRLFFDQDLARIRVEVSEDASVRADPQHLERMLTNLLTNAFKYSPADGPVVIRAEPEGANVAIVVVDQGPGISMEDQARAFKRVFKGDGVGLYVTRVLAEAQGGSVSLRSTPGTRGSEFRVLLPMPKMPA